MDVSPSDRTIDPAAREMLERAERMNVSTGWDRFMAMQDVCAFGELGLCCRNCMMGPCRIDPFGEGPDRGVCGINADGMVARNLCRMVAAGASAHSDHGAHILEVLERVAAGKTREFVVRDPRKLRSAVERLGLEPGEDASVQQMLAGLIAAVERAYTSSEGALHWLAHTLPPKRLSRLRELGLLPIGVDPTIREALHRTHMGVDADAVNLLMGTLKCALADFLGMDIATTMSDVLLGTPAPAFSRANLGVIDADAVNVAVHGHNPLIVESILQTLPRFHDKAKAAGASKGVNVVGVCCTGNESLMRHGVPLATNAASQELVVLTGAVDAMVVDVQCVMPSLANVCECFHTRLITTMPVAQIPGALHLSFDPAEAQTSAERILDEALVAYSGRKPKEVKIPDVTQQTMRGFSAEAIVDVLAKLSPDDPLGPLVEAIASDAVHGVVLLAGCNNYRVPQDASIVGLAEELAAHNVLLLATGCAAGALSKAGMMSPERTREVCGQKLWEVLVALGNTAGLDRPLPPAWHMGSCVDNSRAAALCFALARRLDVDVDALPVVASAPEAMSEKAVAIGTWAVALGLTTHLGVVPPVLGGKTVTAVLTETLGDLVGARFIVETDPHLAAESILQTLAEKRAG